MLEVWQIIQTTYYRIHSKKNVKLKVSLVADLHNNECKDVIDILQKEKPDIIVVAGDLMTLPYDEKRHEAHSLKYRIFAFVYGTLQSIFAFFITKKKKLMKMLLPF